MTATLIDLSVLLNIAEAHPDPESRATVLKAAKLLDMALHEGIVGIDEEDIADILADYTRLLVRDMATAVVPE